MKFTLSLLVISSTLFAQMAPAQSKGKLIPPSEEGCTWVKNYAAALLKEGKKLPPKSKAFKELCADFYKNTHKYDLKTEKFIARPLGD